MGRGSARAYALFVCLVAAASIPAASPAVGQTGPGWVSRFDGKAIGSERDRVGESNWRVNPMPKAGGKWNTFEITAKGRQITVVLNGLKTVELHNGLFAEGPLTLQHGDGVIKFRKVAVKPL
ncbi:MAG TPA: family 16 glycoside hydrolase [Methylomirabilota bacterium]|nr:family 16 glycoside hydrolase [Methylomirabilota bacterium]